MIRTPAIYRFLQAILVLCLYCSCATHRSATVSTQKKRDLPPLPTSEIDIPIKIAAAPLFVKGEELVPTTFTSDAWPNFLQPTCDFRYKYRFVRSALQITCVNNSIGVAFGGNYQVAGGRTLCTAGVPVTPWVSGSCGFVPEPMRKVSISLHSILSFKPGYQVLTKTGVTKISATDRCQVSLFSSDITQLVVDSIRSSLLAFTNALDQTISGLSFATFVRRAADSSSKKMRVGIYGYLQLNPSAVRVGQLNYYNDSFSISAGMSLHPLMTSDSSNLAARLRSLPPLQQLESRNGIRLYTDAIYDYAFLSKLLQDSLYNKVFEVKGRTIVVKEASMRGLGDDQLEIKISFSGSNHGSIFVRGAPVLDTARQILTMEHITYSMEGEDLALKIGRSLFRNKIRKTIQGKSYLDLGALVKSNLPKVSAMMNRELTKGVFSSGRAMDVRLIGLAASAENIHVQLFFAGEMAVLSNGIF